MFNIENKQSNLARLYRVPRYVHTKKAWGKRKNLMFTEHFSLSIWLKTKNNQLINIFFLILRRISESIAIVIALSNNDDAEQKRETWVKPSVKLG